MGRNIIITGASKGIGFATAVKLADVGDRVINLSRTPAADSRIENYAIDLSKDDAEKRLASLLDELALDDAPLVVIHNAARLQNDATDALGTPAFREIIELNVVAPHMLNQMTIPRMTEGSAIIYVGSTLSEKAVPGSYSYVTTKHAMIGMMRATCQDLAGRGIHTACVCPGFTNTEMLREHVGNDPDVLDVVAGFSTFNRLIEPDEIAHAIVFCVDHPVINGAVIHANLGQREQ